MSINSVTKIAGKVVKSGKKIIGKKGLRILVPDKAVECDILSGTGRKGNYQQFVFKNKNGHPVQIYTRYDNNGEIKDVVSDYAMSGYIFDLVRRTISGRKTSTEYVSLLSQKAASGEVFCSKSFMIASKEGEKGGIELLRKGKKPVGISFDLKWDGAPAKLKYKNARGHKLNLTDEEARHLPFVPRRYVMVEQNGQQIVSSADFTTEGAQKKIGLAQIIQEKFHDIEGLLPRAKAVEVRDLHIIKTSGLSVEEFLAQKGFLPQGEHLGNGQINIVVSSNNNSDGLLILDIMAHEVKHASDVIKMYRGGAEATSEALKKIGLSLEEWNKGFRNEFDGLNAEKYIEKIIKKKGLAIKGTAEYEDAVNLYEMNFRTTAAKDLNSVAEHDNLSLEKRAIEREGEQIQFYTEICQKITNFLLSFFDK